MAYYMDEQLLVDTGCRLLHTRTVLTFWSLTRCQDDQLRHHLLCICQDGVGSGILLANAGDEAGRLRIFCFSPGHVADFSWLLEFWMLLLLEFFSTCLAEGTSLDLPPRT
jgi:hypothetical protein